MPEVYAPYLGVLLAADGTLKTHHLRWFIQVQCLNSFNSCDAQRHKMGFFKKISCKKAISRSRAAEK